MNKELLKASWVRAYRSFLQAIVAQIPTGFVITPVMIQHFKISYVYVIVAILCNAVLYAVASFATCMIGGLPEVALTDTLYALDNDPDEEDDIEEVGDGTEDDEEGDE